MDEKDRTNINDGGRQRLPGSAPAHYSRLFPNKTAGYPKQDLIDLAIAMKAGEDVATDLKTHSGVVYFGQFIDHDLTRDRTKLEQDPYPEPKDTPNWRTPRLDLDSVYGNGPASSVPLPEGDYVAYRGDRFQLSSIDGNEVDLPRDQNAIPQIAESRNDENLVISQLHVVFMKFHNRVVDLLEDPALSFPAPPGRSIFERARRFVVWHYQWIVREGFLRQIIHPDVLWEITELRCHPKLFDATPGEVVALPVEFTMAAFRFGHSMVRDTYRLRDDADGLTLSELLNRDARKLEPRHVIEWKKFFGPERHTKINAAQRIDTTLAKGFYALPDRIILLYKEIGPPSEHSLAARTLIRGSKIGLPSGQELCQMARIPFITFKESDRDFDLLRRCRMLHRTPLWYYLLHEAEMAGTDVTGAGGRYLGPLGGRVVAETILAVLKSDPDSYPLGWQPPRFALTLGGPEYRIDSFQKLIAFAFKASMSDIAPAETIL